MHHPIIKPNHMQIPWHDPIRDQKELPVSQAPLPIRAGVVGRVGLLLLSCGTGAWRVRSSMNEIAEALGLVCAADIGLLSIEYTCSDGENSFSQTLTLTATGVNTAKLDQLERFVKRFPLDGVYMTADDLHTQLDKIAQTGGSYTPLQLGLAAALACGGFTFLLGGGPIEMLLAFLGAGVGQYVRARLTQRHLTLFGCIALSVAAACLVYAGLFRLASLLFPIEAQHQAGYICAMLFIIPGFPFITSGIDMAKQDMRSGLERLAYAIMIVVVATLTAWLMALLLRLQPMDFLPLGLPVWARILLRLAMSFCGVFGFSLMFNSPVELASVAAVIGALSNTLRLELVSLAGFPPAAAAFFGALTAGLLASLYKQRSGYPRITITVPSIVIMVPGLYFYRAVYDLGTMNLSDSASWLVASLLIVAALPLGLICARILTDGSFRRCT